jgi:hypothetical protein
MTGYNQAEVENLRDVINSTAQAASTGIVDRLHTEIIVPMSKAWYAPEAQTFFQEFATVVANSGENIKNAFDLFKNCVQEAGSNWAENTGGQAPVLANLDDVTLNLSVSEILEKDDAGNVGIIDSSAEAVVNTLATVEDEIKSDLQSLAANLNAETAFLGGSQASAIQECFVKVSGEIHKIFSYLATGDDSLVNVLNACRKKYTDVASGVSTAFNSTTVE